MKQSFLCFGARALLLSALAALTLASCSKDSMQDEIVPAPESETPGYGPKSEIAPGSLKIVCTPEATGDDNSRLEKFVEYTFQAIYIDWAPGPVAEFVYIITKGDLVKPGYVRTDPKNGMMKVTFTSPGIYKITLRCLNYPNNVRTRTFNVHEDVVPWNPVEVQM